MHKPGKLALGALTMTTCSGHGISNAYIHAAMLAILKNNTYIVVIVYNLLALVSLNTLLLLYHGCKER